MNWKFLFKPRMLILIFLVLLSLLWIQPQFNTDGVAIKSVSENSTAYDAGIRVIPNAKPTSLETIHFIDNQEIMNLEDYTQIIQTIPLQSTFKIDTDKNSYTLLKQRNDIGISVADVAGSNIGKGLDLAGGTRVILRPETELSDEQFAILLETMRNRLDFYGVKDIKIKETNDLLGNKFVVVEVAGATKEDVKELVASQGQFEARIGEEVVFEGGLGKDIAHVCRDDGRCASVRNCRPATPEGYACQFEFAVTLTNEAAQRHADVTADLDINSSVGGQGILSKTIDLYLDGQLFDSLTIGASLKGQKTTQIAISGPGFGFTQEESFLEAQQAMNKLQTVLETGSLPTSLEIVELKTISPALGSAFVSNAFKTGLLALLGVALVIFLRYRKLKIAVPMVVISTIEVFLIVSVSTLIGYRLDLAAIAGIIAAVGTGFDDLLVITDEALEGRASHWKQRIKSAFFIVFVAWATLVAAMVPLFWAGAGLFTGFAVTTILGVSIGVFITRPAYGVILEELFKNSETQSAQA